MDNTTKNKPLSANGIYETISSRSAYYASLDIYEQHNDRIGAVAVRSFLVGAFIGTIITLLIAL